MPFFQDENIAGAMVTSLYAEFARAQRYIYAFCKRFLYKWNDSVWFMTVLVMLPLRELRGGSKRTIKAIKNTFKYMMELENKWLKFYGTDSGIWTTLEII